MRNLKQVGTKMMWRNILLEKYDLELWKHSRNGELFKNFQENLASCRFLSQVVWSAAHSTDMLFLIFS